MRSLTQKWNLTEYPGKMVPLFLVFFEGHGLMC